MWCGWKARGQVFFLQSLAQDATDLSVSMGFYPTSSISSRTSHLTYHKSDLKMISFLDGITKKKKKGRKTS